jgi:hypothetical protein
VLLIRFLILSEYLEPFVPANYYIPLEIKALLLFAITLVGWGFYTIPSFTEFDWKDKIQSLYLLNQSGICLYNHDFQPASSVTDEDLFGGGLMAMQSLIQELIQSEKGLNVIDHQEVKIIFLQSANAIAVLISEEDLYIGRQKIQQFLKEFELLYGEIMKDWVGDLHIFKPLTPIVNRIFEED